MTNITAVRPESNVSEYTQVLWCTCDLKNYMHEGI